MADDLRMPGAEPLSRVRAAGTSAAMVPAGAATDGWNASRYRPPSRGRMGDAGARRGITVCDDSLPEPSPGSLGIPRFAADRRSPIAALAERSTALSAERSAAPRSRGRHAMAGAAANKVCVEIAPPHGAHLAIAPDVSASVLYSSRSRAGRAVLLDVPTMDHPL